MATGRERAVKNQIRQEVLRAEVKALHDRNYVSAAAGNSFALFLAAVFRDLFDQGMLPIGILLKGLTALARMPAGHLCDGRRSGLSDKNWAMVHRLALAGHGMAWSWWATFFRPAGRPEFAAGATAIIFGLAALGAAVLAPCFPAHRALSKQLRGELQIASQGGVLTTVTFSEQRT